MLTDNEIKKLREDIVFSETLRDIPFVFHSTWGIFSPRNIDEGTLLLLKYLDIKETDDCLDLGCGYGPIGLTMAKLAPKGQTILVDKDFKAVEYSNINAELNQITNAKALLSNGFDQIHKQKFNIVVSNIPAKVGNEMLSIFLYDAFKQMKHGGKIYVVTITGLRKYIKRNFEEVFGNYKKLKQGSNYTVAMATKE
ncbi:MAG TPA: methyltransferase domain-containing protein [Gammaproteobacteria bacterium]|nr:methyltransferase domain-containing protein [Gammaproteobacteria bacterium]